MWFDESRLDDAAVFAPGTAADLRLRALAASGGRVRREAGVTAEARERAVERIRESGRPRAVIVAGPDARLVRAVLEPVCPVPFVAWSHGGLPGWAGSLDLVVVLAPEDSSAEQCASTVAEAVRRGSQVVVACSVRSLVAEHVTGSSSSLLPVETSDPLAVAVSVLDVLGRLGLGPTLTPDGVADALDVVAALASPYRDLSGNAAKSLAVALADATPLVWGGPALAARAARRVAEALRRASGRPALSGDAEHLAPVIEATVARNLFDDPFDGGSGEGSGPRPALLVLDDAEEPVWAGRRRTLTELADAHDVRVEVLAAEDAAEPVARYAALVLQGGFAAEYLRLGLVD
jgi:hypothetical protein